ncbi:PIH1D1 isoform 24, partial [Pan troglodytes]
MGLQFPECTKAGTRPRGIELSCIRIAPFEEQMRGL